MRSLCCNCANVVFLSILSGNNFLGASAPKSISRLSSSSFACCLGLLSYALLLTKRVSCVLNFYAKGPIFWGTPNFTALWPMYPVNCSCCCFLSASCFARDPGLIIGRGLLAYLEMLFAPKAPKPSVFCILLSWLMSTLSPWRFYLEALNFSICINFLSILCRSQIVSTDLFRYWVQAKLY